MEVVKTNETYRISDTKKDTGWEMTGTANRDTTGSIGINFSIMKPGELVEEIGHGNYNKELGSNRVNISYSTYESKETDFVAYMKEIIETVKTNFA